MILKKKYYKFILSSIFCLFQSLLICQEFNDSTSVLDKPIETSYFKKVHRDTIYKVEKRIYISKDTCPEEFLNDLYGILKMCPYSENISKVYTRDKKIWTSMISDSTIEKGKFKKERGSFIVTIFHPFKKNEQKLVDRHGKWEFYNKWKNEVIIREYKNGEVVKK